MKFKAYHKIGQFKDIVRDVKHQANFRGLDECGEPIYEETVKPTVKFKGTVKLHGTNAGVCYHPNSGMFAQKRKPLTEIIDKQEIVVNNGFLKKDHVVSHEGFTAFINHTEKSGFETMMKNLWSVYCTKDEQITLYGEWAGLGIQKGVAISTLHKAFYIFDCKIYNLTTEEERWVDISELSPQIDNAYNIHQFETYSLYIDFNKPELFQTKLAEFTEIVEKECPVSKAFGAKKEIIKPLKWYHKILNIFGFNFKAEFSLSVGEGIVWTGFWNGQKYIFKVKGEKHSSSKVKVLAKVDPEIVKNIYEFVEYACTKNRIEQTIQENGIKQKSDMPKLLSLIANDIMDEEADVLKANGLEWKQVANKVANKVRQHLFAKLDKI